jgi:hypothetical protein
MTTVATGEGVVPIGDERDGWSERNLPFVRHEGLGVSTVAMLRTRSRLQSGEEIVDAIVRAMTVWVGSTEAGRRAWSGTCQDLNVGDLLVEGYLQDEELKTLMLAQGVVVEEGLIADCEEAFSYDKVLVDANDDAVRQCLDE